MKHEMLWRLINRMPAIGGAADQFWKSPESGCLRSFHIDQQLELGRLLNWKIGGIGTFEDLVDVLVGTPMRVG